MEETLNDLIVPWTSHGPRLAREILAYADELDTDGRLLEAERLRAIIRCEYSALPPDRPQLGDPPTLRPAVPRAPEPGS